MGTQYESCGTSSRDSQSGGAKAVEASALTVSGAGLSSPAAEEQLEPLCQDATRIDTVLEDDLQGIRLEG